METIARKISTSHFLLMFGYKLFSLYFPLFLVWKGLSLTQVGYTYLFIYLPMAAFSPIAGFICSRTDEKILVVIGICGYFIYSLGMILNVGLAVFYFFQIILGISAALFFVACRSLMVALAERPKESFAWFYSMPTYVQFAAPAIGAIIIWQFNFIAVFILSFGVHLINIVYSFIAFKNINSAAINQSESFSKIKSDYFYIFKKIKNKEVLLLLFLVFFTLILAGFYRAFFVLYLKEQLDWTQNNVLFFVSLVSVAFVPISWKVIRLIESQMSRTNVLQGSFFKAVVTIMLGLGYKYLSFLPLFILKLTERISFLMIGSGRSGYFAQKFRKYPEEISTIDSAIVPLGVAIGSLLGGFLLAFLSFAEIFQWSGIILFIATITIWFFSRRK